ncbi:MAG: S8 family peptidase [Terricaulis sp.]
MAQYEHLSLTRLPERMERRRQPGFGSAPPRDPGVHGPRLAREVDVVLADHRRTRPAAIDPALILRVRLDAAVSEEQWASLGLTLLSSDPDRSLVLFASEQDLHSFRERLTAYSGPVREGKANPPYASFVSAISAVEPVSARDRIGRRLKDEGFAGPEDFDVAATYIVDVEVWDLGTRALREAKISEIDGYVTQSGGAALDRYVGPSVALSRVRVRGDFIGALLDIPEVASIDLPPALDTETATRLDLSLAQVPPLGPVADDAPIIGIIDSGVNDHPLIGEALIGAIASPDRLGTADAWGHGTRVAGVALFGDLSAQLDRGALERPFRLCSARVVNDTGNFDPETLVPSVMRDAIGRLHQQFGCRIFVVPLADRLRVYDGGKVGVWAATLDEIARELDVLIICSAGNRYPRSGEALEEAVTEYPRYLGEDANRLFEPAGAINVATVGALAHGPGLDQSHADDARVRAIAEALEPAPFTRIGPGPEGAIKPDFVEIGGTMVFDPVVRQLLRGGDLASAGVLTLHHAPLDRLFAAVSGTSFAAPRLAFKAASLLGRLPDASANLLRALLALAAEPPEPARERLSVVDEELVTRVCGHGTPDLERAAFSDDPRVVLYADDELALDHFAIYEIPIPSEFQNEPGRRHLRVALAYDPPVRHTRADYAGLAMNFRVFRGCDPALLFEHYRRRTKDEGDFPEIEARYGCKLAPGPRAREGGPLQCAEVVYKRDVSAYGDVYHLVVRCESGWAVDRVTHQRFAVAVEIAHERPIQLYARVRERVRV